MDAGARARAAPGPHLPAPVARRGDLPTIRTLGTWKVQPLSGNAPSNYCWGTKNSLHDLINKAVSAPALNIFR